MSDRDLTYPVAVSDDDGSTSLDYIVGDIAPLLPVDGGGFDKFSPLKMQPTDGWANGQPDTGTPATFDPTALTVPTFTSAKKRSICIITVAGSFNGQTVAVNDFLMALQDNPTLPIHWQVISDSAADFVTAVNAAKGSPVALYGTYLLKNANPDAAINLVGEYTILNLCGYPAIYPQNNNTRAALNTPRQVAVAGAGVATGVDVDDEIGTTLQQVTFFTLTTPADAANFYIGQMVKVFTDATHVASALSSSKIYIGNSFKVTSIDPVAGTIYADRVIKYHNKIANASNIYIVPMHDDRPIKTREGAQFMGAPTIIGGEVGWWLTLDGIVFRAATISGSGSSRTLSYTGANLAYIVNQGVRIGSVSGTPEASCKITAFNYSGGVNTITISVATKNDKGQAWTAPTSGTVYFNPAFWTSEFDTNSHGAALILQQAHGSKVFVDAARMWSATVKCRFTDFSSVKVRPQKVVNIGTGINGKSWRLTYDCEVYVGCRNDIEIISEGPGMDGRHPYTNSPADTSITWASTLWVFRSGVSCENKVKIRSKTGTGPAGDTHGSCNGEEIDSEVDNVATFNTAHSYRGVGAQLRGENEIRRHKQRGGQIGLRIANGSDYIREPGSIDTIDLEVNDLPLRADAHAFTSGGSSSQLPCGFNMMTQEDYTGGTAGSRTLAVGRMRFKNAGAGFSMEKNTRGRFSLIEHTDVGYALGYLQDGAACYGEKVGGDYSLSNGVATTSATSLAIGTGSKSITVATGLNIQAGQDVLAQDGSSTANSKATYGWGRVVSYNSGTGALVMYLEGIKGSGTLTSWIITTGAKIPRYGVVMAGASEFTFGTFTWKVGAGANPTEVFHSKDNTGGKVVKGGVLIIDDPLNIGMPNIITSGRSADFTLQIGIIIYNGKVVNSIGTGNLTADFDGGGAAIPVNKKCRTVMTYAGQITNWTVAADQSGSIVVDVKKNGTSMVGAGNKPTLSSAQNASAAPASWTTTTFAKGDIIEWNADSVTTVTQANVVLEAQKL